MTMFPSPPSFASSSAAEDALQRVRTTIAVSHGLVSTGRAIDLTGLDAATGMLCARILDLPPTEGAVLRRKLAELEAKLALLQQTLIGQHR